MHGAMSAAGASVPARLQLTESVARPGLSQAFKTAARPLSTLFGCRRKTTASMPEEELKPAATGSRHLELPLLRSFVAVVQAQRFGAAGERIGRTQSAVSLRIKRLEKMLGRRLLYRSARGAFLTSDGQLLFDRALAMLRLNDELLVQFGVMRRSLAVGVPGLLAQQRLGEVLGALQRRLDGGSLQLRVADSRTLQRDFDEGLLDLVVLALPPDATVPPGVPARTLRFAWASAAGTGPEDWPQQQLPPLLQLDGEGIPPDVPGAHIALATSDAQAYLSAIRCGLGVGCVPAGQGDPLLQTWPLWPGLPPPPVRCCVALWRTGAPLALGLEDAARRLLALLPGGAAPR
jgi:DNA-binding transcriptional LysR family regulator